MELWIYIKKWRKLKLEENKNRYKRVILFIFYIFKGKILFKIK